MVALMFQSRNHLQLSIPMANSNTIPKLRVVIIGAGPAGLGAAIEFAKLPFVDLKIYEQARELREVGTGISLQRNTWRLLDAFGVLENIDPSDFFRSADGHSVQHRNGRTGELLLSNGQKGENLIFSQP